MQFSGKFGQIIRYFPSSVVTLAGKSWIHPWLETTLSFENLGKLITSATDDLLYYYGTRIESICAHLKHNVGHWFNLIY